MNEVISEAAAPAERDGPAGVMSRKVWPIVRVVLVQLVLMSGIFGKIVAILLLVLLVDKLRWLDIDFHGKTFETIAPGGRVLGLAIIGSVNLGLVLLAWRWLERKRLSDLWLDFSRKAWRPLGLGLAFGLAEVTAVVAALAALGALDVRWGLAALSSGAAAKAFGWLLASVVLAPVVEEILNRGYWFQNLRRGWGEGVAVGVPAALFGALHLLNPNPSWLGALNIAIGAVGFAVGMICFRSLLFPIGWHAAWNFAQFFIAGLPNSGFSVQAMGVSGATLLTSRPLGSSWLTGGEFGIEASLVDTVAVLSLTIALLVRARRQRTPGTPA